MDANAPSAPEDEGKSAAFRAISREPLNGAPRPDALVFTPVTPVDHFFVRNHGTPGDPLDATAVRVHGLVQTELDARALLDAGLPRASVEATLQCAGNRRDGLNAVRPIRNELPWDSAAIGNAVWEGVRLADVLRAATVRQGAAHVWFEGADVLGGGHAGEAFGASIPLEKALAGDVLLADTMNGAPLTRAHGAPLRVVVPGYIGARSVKWLRDICVAPDVSPNRFQRAYSVFPPSVLEMPADATLGAVLGEFPVSSAFGVPLSGAELGAGPCVLRGWSIAGGDRTVERVEISVDHGAQWFDARFTSPARRFVWRLWECDAHLAPGEHTLLCRATDSGGHTQPVSAESTWNVRGYAHNAWDVVRVRAV